MALMNIMIASDIHGSAYYCRLLMEAVRREQAGRLLLLGDILYHGPRNDLPREYDPKAVIAMLSDLTIPVSSVRGNCDADVDQMVLPFPILSDSCLLFVEDKTIFATHGHLFHKDHLPPLSRGDVLLHGHTHVPAWEWLDEGVLYLNPGSAALPKEESPHSYMMLSGRDVYWKTMDGTVFHHMTI